MFLISWSSYIDCRPGNAWILLNWMKYLNNHFNKWFLTKSQVTPANTQWEQSSNTWNKQSQKVSDLSSFESFWADHCNHQSRLGLLWIAPTKTQSLTKINEAPEDTNNITSIYQKTVVYQPTIDWNEKRKKSSFSIKSILHLHLCLDTIM